MILHEFFSKDVSSKAVINARSAMAWTSKRTILTQEVLRVLLNCSRLLPWEVTTSHVSEMMHRIQYSGYNQRFRYKVLSSSLKAYERIIKDKDSGEKPMYRTREWQKEERESQKERK